MIMTMPAAETAVKPLVEPRCAAECTGVHVVSQQKAATTMADGQKPRRTYDRTRTESQQLWRNHRCEVLARGLEYGFSNCHREEVSRDQAETRIYRHKGQELNTFCSPECRRSSRQQRSRLQSTT
jgi:hypothetical protein